MTKSCLLIGAASMLPLVSVSTSAAGALTERVLYNFSPANGVQPVQSTLVSDDAGNLYGTTYQAGPNGAGDVFKLSPRGKLTVLLAFPDQFGGALPWGGVLRDDEGNLYGSAGNVVFKLAPDGKETALHVFTGTNGDGATINARLIRDAKGNIYGTTSSGGDFDAGTLFKVSPRGKETVLHSFNGTTDGSSPGPLVMDRHGDLYGLSNIGGSDNCQGGCGTVFKITKKGQFSVVYSFTGGNDGAGPAGPLFIDQSGNMFGTAQSGGDLSCGTVFKVTPKGEETSLHIFTYNEDFHDACDPASGLSVDATGDLMGTSIAGGDNGSGAVFMIDPDGNEKILYSFGPAPDAAKPEGVLFAGPHRKLYGASVAGGENGWGTVFELSHK